MTAESTRTIKEARALLYPWCAVIMLCTLPRLSSLYNPQRTNFASRPDEFTNFIFQIGVLLGIPLLASLSFGNEFRHKTMDLLVSQPVHRLSIWREKWSVTALAVATATLIAVVSSGKPLDFTRASTLDYVMFLVVTTCSAPFWTLVGRSTLGGLLLNIAAFLPLISIATSLWAWNSASQFLNSTPAFLILSAAILGYSIAMLWLSRWMLVHRQSGAGMAGPDVMLSIPDMMPARVTSLLRCRPDQVILNLIRREVRLLRPLWFFMALYVAGWSAMAISFSFVPGVGDWQRTGLVILVGLTATYPVIAMFLAASLALGEERAIGIQLWHLALPLSVRTQWLTRLLSGLFAGVLCALAIPAVLEALARAVLRPEFMQKFESMTMIEPALSLIAFFLFTFWCAIVARDLTRTAGLAAAAGGMMFFSFHASLWFTERLTELFEYLLIRVISWYQLNPFAFQEILGWLPDLSKTSEWLLATVFCGLMTIHSYSLFRRLPHETSFKIVRPLVPYLILTMAFVSLMTLRSWNGGWSGAYDLLYETEKAIVKVQPDRAMSGEELLTRLELPDHTRRWLRNSKIDVTLSDSEAINQYRGMSLRGDWKVYKISIQLASGVTCKASVPFDQTNTQILWFGLAKCD